VSLISIPGQRWVGNALSDGSQKLKIKKIFLNQKNDLYPFEKGENAEEKGGRKSR